MRRPGGGRRAADRAADDSATPPAGCTRCRAADADRGATRVAWAAEAEKRTAEDPVLRARQGAPQHRALRRGARRGHSSPSRRCTMPKRTSAADAHARCRRRHRDDGQPSGERRPTRARRARRASCPGLTLSAARRRRVGRRRRGARSAAAPTSPAATSSSPPCCSWKTTSSRCCRRCRRAATHCDAMVCVHVGGRGRQADPHRPLRHGRPAQRRRWRC